VKTTAVQNLAARAASERYPVAMVEGFRAIQQIHIKEIKP